MAFSLTYVCRERPESLEGRSRSQPMPTRTQRKERYGGSRRRTGERRSASSRAAVQLLVARCHIDLKDCLLTECHVDVLSQCHISISNKVPAIPKSSHPSPDFAGRALPASAGTKHATLASPPSLLTHPVPHRRHGAPDVDDSLLLLLLLPAPRWSKDAQLPFPPPPRYAATDPRPSALLRAAPLQPGLRAMGRADPQ